jgi:acetoin utilization deacetylase AcuC-like enzyme
LPYRTRVPAPPWFRHDAHLAHDVPGHPERPARIRALEAEMSANDWFGCERVEAPRAARELLLAVHPESHVASIEALCAAGGGAIDADTYAMEGTYEAALRAAGGAAALVDALLAGEAPTGASLHRPPGHHAETARAMGFCLFNNVAVGARHALDAHGVGRVLILDWDVHHGNGTNDIFHASDEVLFCSIHESPLYPGTGPASDAGSGRGQGFTVNMPVPHGSGDETFCSLVEHVVVPLARAFAPRLVLLSAGYDAHMDDPLAGCRCTEGGYAAMAASMRRLADDLGIPVGLVLEGGYALGPLTRSLVATLEVLGAPLPPAADPHLAVHPLASAAARRLAVRWPALAG